MYKRVAAVSGVFAGLLVLVGCATEPSEGASQNVPSETAASSEHGRSAVPPNEPAGSSPSAETLEALGVVIADGIAYEITEVRSCDPLDDGFVERELELQGLGTVDGARTQIDVYLQSMGGVPQHEVSWSGPEGIFGGPENAEVVLADGGSRVFGSATLVDAVHQEDVIPIEFDLAVPSHTVPCR